jgi:hypothetical protein
MLLVKYCAGDGGAGLSSLRATVCGGVLFLLEWSDLRRNFVAALVGLACPAKMDTGAAAPDLFHDLGGCCGCKGGTAPDSRD